MLFKKLFKIIYDSEINCRIEWMWDNGFTWSIQNASFPRILKDDDLNECFKETVRSERYSEKMKNPVQEIDWIARGNSDDIDDALCDMFDAIIEYLPNSEAAKKLKDFNENREHFSVCQVCGDLFDCRDLGDVFSHEHGTKTPIKIKGKYIAKREGDSEAWHDGKKINLN